MIRSIKFTSSNVIEDTELTFSDGLNAITGETGTGKTVLINLMANALGFSFPIPYYLRSGQVDLYFENEGRQSVITLQLGESRRKLLLDGKQISQRQLKEMFQQDVVISSQFDSRIIDSPEDLLFMVDSYAGTIEIFESYRRLFEEVRDVDNAIKRVQEKLDQSAKVRESLKSELEELEDFNPSVGEYEELKNELLKANQRERILKDIETIVEITDDDTPFNSSLKELRNSLLSLSAFYPEAKDLLDTVEELRLRLQDFRTRSDETLEQRIDVDGINDRLYKYERYFRRYGFGEKSILDRINQLRTELAEIDTLPNRLSDLVSRYNDLKIKLNSTALELDQKRRLAVDQCIDAIQSFLHETNVDGHFTWQWGQAELSILGLGIPKIGLIRSGEFVPASQLSGGEKNRLVLALRTILSPPQSVLIFDEPDAGLGGETLSRLVNLLKQISSNRQIILITHNPQIAAAAQNHFSVERTLNGDKIRVKIELLQGQRRIHEIAKMIAGQYVTATTLELASELVRQLSGGDSFGETYSGN
jgi:DNA repair protein RecN (Recombination protein N)